MVATTKTAAMMCFLRRFIIRAYLFRLFFFGSTAFGKFCCCAKRRTRKSEIPNSLIAPFSFFLCVTLTAARSRVSEEEQNEAMNTEYRRSAINFSLVSTLAGVANRKSGHGRNVPQLHKAKVS